MKPKILPILLFFLIVLNGVLIFMILKKPHENRHPNSERNFLTEQLQFSDTQKSKFIELDQKHRALMEALDEEIKENKDVLFNSFSQENFNIDSLTNKIGLLEGKKDSEVFNFFKKVRKLCNSEQISNFDKIIKKALKGGDRMPPRDGRLPPPPDSEGMPPRR
jgi:hypothetical protein